MYQRIHWRTLGWVLPAAAVLWLALWLLGPVLLPFALGLGLARAAEPVTRRLERRLPRAWAAVVTMAALHFSISAGVFLLCRLLCRELAAFARTLPSLAGSLAGPAQELKAWLLSAARRFPDGIGAALEEGVQSFFQNGAGLPERLYGWVFDGATALVRMAPEIGLFLLVFLLSGFLFAAKLPRLREIWAKRVPRAWQERAGTLLSRLKDTLGLWLKTQVKLGGLVFLLLLTGLWLLGLDYPFLFALVIALLDALPAIGSGIILIPWALLQFLWGNNLCGVGLACLYGAAALLRTSLEPRLLGKQVGLDPLLTLLALYGGFRFFGVLGMILFPLGAIFCKQVWNQRKNG